jgi:dTDP-4-dehydrorhamnose reductase
MNILVIGGTGMLGHKLVQGLQHEHDVWTTIRGSFDRVERFGIFNRRRVIENVNVQDLVDVERVIELARPEVVVNAAGVIKQLPTSKDVITTLLINSILPHRLDQLSEKYGFRLICISTDCVFDGKRGNYHEFEVADAQDLYGQSKHHGEVSSERCLTLRTSIIGRELETDHGLFEWFYGNRGKAVRGFRNAVFSGFPTIVFAAIIDDLILNFRDLTGLYHVSSDPTNKFELLTLINEAFNTRVDIEPFDEFRIDRSLNSDKFKKATGFRPTSWKEMIMAMADDPMPYDVWKKPIP